MRFRLLLFDGLVSWLPMYLLQSGLTHQQHSTGEVLSNHKRKHYFFFDREGFLFMLCLQQRDVSGYSKKFWVDES